MHPTLDATLIASTAFWTVWNAASCAGILLLGSTRELMGLGVRLVLGRVGKSAWDTSSTQPRSDGGRVVSAWLATFGDAGFNDCLMMVGDIFIIPTNEVIVTGNIEITITTLKWNEISS